MKSNTKKIIQILIVLGTIFALLFFSSKNLGPDKNEIVSSNEYINKSAISGKIHIDNNWSVVESAGLCTGNGTYHEPYVIEDLVINGESSGSCILIENSDDYFKIENCTVYNSGYANVGIKLNNVTNAQLIDNNCSSNFRGIYLILSNNNSILNNTVNYNENVGICFTQSTNNIIFNNTVSFTDKDGLYLQQQSNDNTILNNTISFNGDDGIYIYSSGYNEVSGNIISNSDSGIYLTYSEHNILVGNTAINNYYNGIRLSDSDWAEIVGNIVSGNDIGINLYSTNFAIVLENNLTNNNYGIELSHSHFTDFLGNDASNNVFRGIYLTSSNYNNLSGNVANNNGDSGIYLYRSDESYVYGNVVNNNDDYGIYLYYSDNIYLSGTVANNNGDHGIHLFSSNYNNVSNNTINDNGYTGIYLSSSGYNTISENDAISQRNGISLLNSDFNSLLGNTLNYNTFYGVYLEGSRHNNIEGNFINYNNVGIYEEYTRFKKYVIEFIDIETADNEISNNIFNGNSQDVQRITNIITHPSESLTVLIITLLSIATGVIAIGALTAKLIRKQSDSRENEENRRSTYGTAAIIVESVGALIFILCALFLMPLESMEFFFFFKIDSIMFWALILIPFALVGIIISKEGLTNDARNGLAKLGLAFGIPLLILGGILIVIVVVIAVIVLAIIYALIASN